MTADGSGTEDLDALEDQLRTVLEEHPVRLAVLFGSTVRGERHPQSDVDIAVEFYPDVDATFDVPLRLDADLSSALDRNDVDLAVLRTLRPRVGRRAFAEGRLLLGTDDRFERHRRGFERAVEEQDDRAPLAERFDAIIERMDRALEE